MVSDPDSKTLFRRWVKGSTLGWLLGLVLAIALSLLWDVFGGSAQFMVGIGIGAGVGFAQGRVLSDRIGSVRPWMLASALGMGAPFVVGDVAQAVGLAFPYSLPPYVLVGGLVVGTWQSVLLRPVSVRARWWVVGCLVGWAVPAAGLALGDAFRGRLVGFLSLVVIFFGGAILGLASGRSIVWILRSEARGGAPSAA